MRNLLLGTVLVQGALLVAMVTAHSEPDVTTTSAKPKVPPQKTIVFLCLHQYMYDLHNNVSSSTIDLTPTADGLSDMIMGFVDALCQDDIGVEEFLACIHTFLPGSMYSIDHVLSHAVNLTRAVEVRTQGCALKSALNSSIECIVTKFVASPEAAQCVTGISTFFQALAASSDGIRVQQMLHEFCRTWATMLRCVGLYLDTCDPTIASAWHRLGLLILSDRCRNIARPIATSPKLSKQTEGILSLLNANGSAIMSCAQEFNLDMVKFIPTGVVSQTAMTPEEALNAVSSICSGRVDAFMTCLEGKSKNTTSAIDVFMFSIVNITNSRAAYDTLCNNISVLRDNIRCLFNTAEEMKTCMCYMGDLARKIVDISANFSYDKLLDPFCSFFVSFAECYVGLLGSCSPKLAILMEKIHLGGLTSTCRGAKGSTCAITESGAPTVRTSELLECGAPINYHVQTVTSNKAAVSNVEEMMGQIQFMIMDTYRFTCSQRHKLLQCLKERYIPSTSEFDTLLKAMFDFSALESIGDMGCTDTLIEDVERRIQFILSTVMSDPSTTECIESMNVFAKVLTGQIDLDGPTVEFFCRTWGNFVECLEAKISCSSPELAATWRNLSMSAMTNSCRSVAEYQQHFSSMTGLCDVDLLSESAVAICWMTYASVPDLQTFPFPNRPDTLISGTVTNEMKYLCHKNASTARRLSGCLQQMVPSSYLPVDLVMNGIFDVMGLNSVIEKVCSLEKTISQHMDCIVNEVLISRDTGHNCVTYINTGFNVTSVFMEDVQGQIIHGCRNWVKFVACMELHIKSCDRTLAHHWTELSVGLISDKCKHILSQDKTGGSTAVNPHRLLIVLILSMLVIL